MKALLAAALALAAAVVVAGPAAARTDAAPSKRYVVAFAQTNGLPGNADALVAGAGGKIVTRLGAIGGLVATSSDAGFAAALATNASVAAVDEDVVRQLVTAAPAGGAASAAGSASAAGGDPLFGQQWDKQRIGASPTGSYAVQPGRRDVVVAVLDTGADTSHPDVAPNLDLARSRSFVASEPELADHNGHGTWALSAVGAPINGVGISGVAPNVTLVALKVFDRNGYGSFADVSAALVYAADSGFDVASMSFGAYFDKSQQGKADAKLIDRAVRYARSGGVLPIAAAGNDNVDLTGL